MNSYTFFLTNLLKVINFQKQIALSLFPPKTNLTNAWQRFTAQRYFSFSEEMTTRHSFCFLKLLAFTHNRLCKLLNRIHTEIQMLLQKVFDPIVVNKITRQLMSHCRLILMNQKKLRCTFLKICHIFIESFMGFWKAVYYQTKHWL